MDPSDPSQLPADRATQPAPLGSPALPPQPGGAATWLGQLAIWFAGGLAAVVGLSIAAFQFEQQGLAPAVLFPLALGFFLGVALVGAQRGSGLAPSGWLAACALGWGVLAVLGHEFCNFHYYQRSFYQRQAAAARSAGSHAELLKTADEDTEPMDYAAFVAQSIASRGAWRWTLDALLTSVAAPIVVACSLAAPPKAGAPPPAK